MCTGGPCRYWLPQIHELGTKKESQIHWRSLCRRLVGYTYLRKRPWLYSSKNKNKTLAQFFRKKNKEPEAVVFFCDWVVAVVMYIGALH